jgi:V8-like Glu-specific endopeptidase
MIKKFYFLLILTTNLVCAQTGIKNDVINACRNSSVKIISKQGNSSGTGFYISDDIIVTCFHVISKPFMDSTNNINLNIFQDLEAVNEDGNIISLTCISVPTDISPEPYLKDFALLKVNKISNNNNILPLSNNTNFNIADPILFSGYPLGTPTMVTHFGTISGYTKDKSIICIQASTNKGNSGGALLDIEGKVIGIISLREGGITKALQDYTTQINESEKNGSVQIMGIDPLQATKETISVLDTYISTGIGYARSIKFLNDYIIKNKIKI